MNVRERFRIGFDVLGFEVHDLSSDHAVNRARAFCNLGNDSDPCARRALQLGEGFIGLSLQSISRQNRDCLTKHFMAGWPPTPEVVIIERGKVVVDQGVGMQHLERSTEILNAYWQNTFY